VQVYSSKLDFTLPAEKYQIATGAAFLHTTTRNNLTYLKQSMDDDLNDRFTYQETIAAIYADWMFRPGAQWMAKSGARGEYTLTRGSSETTDETTKRNKLHLFPTLYLRYLPDQVNAFNLSFTSRTSRPSYSTLNPFVNYLDEYNSETGNPYLNPDRSFIGELGYTCKGNLTFTATYRYTDDVMGKVTRIDDDTKITSYIWDNYLKNQIVLFNASYRFSRINRLESYINGNIYHFRSMSDAYALPLDYNRWAYLIYLNNSVFFNRQKTLVGQLSAQLQSGERYADKATKSRYRITAGMRYTALKGKLTLGAQVQNLLSNNTRGIIYSDIIRMHYTETTYRIFRISATYSFGAKLQSRQRNYSNSDIGNRLE